MSCGGECCLFFSMKLKHKCMAAIAHVYDPAMYTYMVSNDYYILRPYTPRLFRVDNKYLS